jgi:hypothetical protein
MSACSCNVLRRLHRQKMKRLHCYDALILVACISNKMPASFVWAPPRRGSESHPCLMFFLYFYYFCYDVCFWLPFFYDYNCYFWARRHGLGVRCLCLTGSMV